MTTDRDELEPAASTKHVGELSYSSYSRDPLWL